MDAALFGLFLLTSLAVAAAPGPSTVLVLSQALSGDPRRPASLIAGAFCGNVLLVAATVLGLSSVLLASQTAFAALRVVGAAYLLYLGLRYWFSRPRPLQNPAPGGAPYRLLFLQAFLTSVTNPKGLAFYFAFLPQFLTPGLPIQPQLALLGACYVAIFIAVLAGYALAGRHVARLFASVAAARLKNRLTGGFLILSGLALLRAERP